MAKRIHALIDLIESEMRDDDEPRDRQSERMARDYKSASPEARKAVDDAFVCLCGWTLATLIATAKAGKRKPE
jgi:hypothetical protein